MIGKKLEKIPSFEWILSRILVKNFLNLTNFKLMIILEFAMFMNSCVDEYDIHNELLIRRPEYSQI